MRQLVSLERAEPTAAGKAPASKWGARQAVFLVGAFITAAALGTGVVLHLKRSPPPLGDVETLSPAWTAILWEELRRGVDQQPPWQEQHLHNLMIHRRWMNVVGFLVAVGLLTTASSLLIRKPRARPPDQKPRPRLRRGQGPSSR